MDNKIVLESIKCIVRHLEAGKLKILDFVERAYQLDKDLYILRIQTEKGYYSVDTLHGLAIYNNNNQNKIIQLDKQQNDIIRYGYSVYRD